MDTRGRCRNIGPGVITVVAVLFALLATAGRASAQIDLSGEWAARVHEDAPQRMGGEIGVSIGDYTGLPITAGARLRADSWDASIQDLLEHQAIPASSPYAMRGGATNLRISKVVDDATQAVIAFKIVRSPASGGIRMIWMDGRAHPPPYAAHTWQGVSTGTWEGDTLVVETTHLKADSLQLNGVMHSDLATMSEHFMRHGAVLTVVTVVTDPINFEEPFIRSTSFATDLHQQLAPVVLTAADIVNRPPGYVPHHLPGTNQFLQEFAAKYHIPFEATRGGKETTYPEYQLTIKALAEKTKKNPGSP